jgi:uncharacterized protein with PQ loop repeat
MHLTILDPNVNLTTNIFLVIANILNLVYNIPQIVKTYQTASTKDFSGWFLSLRVAGNLIWVGYAIEVDSMLMLINNIVTVISSIFIGYYKILEYRSERYSKLYEKDNLHELDTVCINYESS